MPTFTSRHIKGNRYILSFGEVEKEDRKEEQEKGQEDEWMDEDEWEEEQEDKDEEEPEEQEELTRPPKRTASPDNEEPVPKHQKTTLNTDEARKEYGSTIQPTLEDTPRPMATQAIRRSAKLQAQANRSFLCQEPGCTKKFGRRAHLQSHIKTIHRGERPFSCTESGCTKKFGLQAHLQNHIKKVHRRERPFLVVGFAGE